MKSDFRDWRGRTREIRERFGPFGETARGIGAQFREAFIQWWRDGQVQDVATACMLFIALAIAGIEADDYLAAAMNVHDDLIGVGIWTKWAPLPLALIVLVIGMVRGGVWTHQPRVLAVTVGIAAILVMRLWVALNAPLTDIAFREITDLLTAGLLGLAIWVTARRRPGLTFAVWIVSLVVMLVSRIGLWSIHFIFTPDLMPVMLSLVWSFVVLGGMSGRALAATTLAINRKIGNGRFGSWNVSEVFLTIVPAHVAALLIGGLLAGLCLQYTRIPVGDNPLGETYAEKAVDLLWTHSVAFGWGRAPLLRLARVLTEPLPVRMPVWMGLSGFVASYGITGLAVLALGSMLVLRMALGRMQDRHIGIGSGPQMALLAVQGLLAMMIVGGPNSSVPVLLCGGWLGLAFAGRTRLEEKIRTRDTSTAAQRRQFYAGAFSAAVVFLIAFFGTVAAFPPVLCRSILVDLSKRPLHDPVFRSRAYLAADLNPWNPRVELAKGAYLRDQLDLSLNWDEGLYQRIVSTYERAMRLDPYDPLIALRLAEVQVTAKRIENAFNTALRALEYNPASPELISWTFVTAQSQKSTKVAMAAVDQTLRISPAASRWWRERYELDQTAGRGSQATSALSIALTSAVGRDPGEEAELVKASFERFQIAQQIVDEAAPAEEKKATP